jgi:outer membrane protein assembly factor BamB
LKPPLDVKWVYDIENYYADSISVSDNMVFIAGDYRANNSNKIYALDLTGDQIWSSILKNGSGGANTPGYSQNIVYLGGQKDDDLYAIDTLGGNILWTTSGFGSLFGSSVNILDDIIYTFRSSGLKAVAKTGDILWSSEKNGWAGNTAVWKDTIVGLSWKSRPFALNLIDGKELWQREDIITYFSDAIAVNDLFFLGSMGEIIALDLNDGQTTWTTRLPFDFSLTNVSDYDLAYANGVLVSAGGIRSDENSIQPQKILLAMDAVTGDILWQTDIYIQLGVIPLLQIISYMLFLSKSILNMAR